MGDQITTSEVLNPVTGDKETVTSTTHTQADPSAPDSAYIKRGNRWVRPTRPNIPGVVWVPNIGWTNKESQASNWGYNLAVIESDNGLNDVFKRAWQSELHGSAWSKETFIAEIKKQPWYKTKSVAQREYDIAVAQGKRSPDYVEIQSKINKALAGVRTTAEQQGLQFSDTELKHIATDVVRNGYNDIELNGIFSKLIKTRKGGVKEFFDNISGETGVGADKNTILDWAKKNGITVAEDWVSGQVQQILAGNHDVQKSKDYITSLAKNNFPAYADKLDSKSSVMDLAQTYAQKIATMLEVPFEQVDLSNDHLKNALAPDVDGKPKNITQVEQELRGTADWAKTNNAKETSNSIVNSILNKFGLM
jgi:hypothetical protein